MPEKTSSHAPRSLADELRTWDDDRLGALLVARSELLAPPPTDLSTLANRAASRPSVARAIDGLTLFESHVLDALAALREPSSVEAVCALLAGRREQDLVPNVHATIDRLRGLALVWGGDDALRLVGSARQVLGDTPAGLGPWLAEALAGSSPARLQHMLADLGLPGTPDPVSAIAAISELLSRGEPVDALLAEAPSSARDVLDRLTWGPPFGSVSGGELPPRAADARTPVEWLLARALLVPWSRGTVALPRELAFQLRCHVDGRGLHRDLAVEPPGVTAAPRPGRRAEATSLATVDAAGAGQAMAAVGAAEALLESWSGGGPPVLRSGGVGIRDLRRVAATVRQTESEAAVTLELASTAGLLGRDGDEDVWLPSTRYDEWLAADIAQRWWRLALGWLDTTRAPGLVGGRDDKDRLYSALGPGIDRPLAVEVRHGVLRALAELAPGETARAEDLVAYLTWCRPRHGGSLLTRLVEWTLAEAALLGVTGMGALSGFGRCLLDRDEAGALAALRALLPEPVDHVLVQADLTAVAPGPLTTELAHTLAVIADVESTGGATVYRFTPESIRHALDVGFTAVELHELLAKHSRTPVPQPLTYLIDDVARRHGRVRVGTATSYLRCDDDALLQELVADRRLAPLKLRRLAPGVLVTEGRVGEVLERMREAGYTPSAESAEGAVLTARAAARRAAHPERPEPVVSGPPTPTSEGVAAAVRLLRNGDRVHELSADDLAALSDASPDVPRLSSTEVLVELLQAAADERSLWISYVDADGRASRRMIDPITVADGHVTAFDHLRAAPRTFALHRITGLIHAEKD
jgi:hypothetical protein